MPFLLGRSTRRSQSSRQCNKDGEKKDHRRSWHVATTSHHDNNINKSTRRRRRTWHFPRLSLHEDSERQNNTKNGIGNGLNAGERKTFSYAASARTSSHQKSGAAITIDRNETVTRAPSPPDSTDTEAVSTTLDPYVHLRDGNNNSCLTKQGTKKSDGWVQKIKRKTGRVVQAVEGFLFPGFCHPQEQQHRNRQNNMLWNRSRYASKTKSKSATIVRVRGGVLLSGCFTAEEHKAKVQETCEIARALHGEQGLRAAGFEFRLVACPEHTTGKESRASDLTSADALVGEQQQQQQQQQIADKDEIVDSTTTDSTIADNATVEGNQQSTNIKEGSLHMLQLGDTIESEKKEGDDKTETAPLSTGSPINSCDSLTKENADEPEVTQLEKRHICHLCSSRLFHVQSNTQIENENRKYFIADGDMYDTIARMCQENAQEKMQRDYNMRWVTVCSPDEEDKDECENGLNPYKRNREEPIRALVNAEHPLLTGEYNDERVPAERLQRFASRPTLLIATGKGKVRAGIFSRQHLLITAMEASTALPLIHEAQMRELNLVIIDPNVHGDAMGNVTFQKSMAKLFRFWEGTIDPRATNNDDEDKEASGADRPFSNRDLYILSHSASGSHLCRYLLEKSEYYLPHLRAIAFTDSTHNVQWARQKNNHELLKMLESPACVYFRCASTENEANFKAGDKAPCDNFWKHRFGNIQTYWAGTKEHSLTNWFAHAHIWEHFDRFLTQDSTAKE